MSRDIPAQGCATLPVALGDVFRCYGKIGESAEAVLAELGASPAWLSFEKEA